MMPMSINSVSEKKKYKIHRFKCKIKYFTLQTKHRIKLFQLFSKEERANVESFCPELHWKAMLSDTKITILKETVGKECFTEIV